MTSTLATRVTKAELKSAADLAENTGENIAANLSALMDMIQSQGGASFQGGGGNALQGKASELNNDLRVILQTLNKLANDTYATGNDFGSTDGDIQNEINTVGGQFTGGHVAAGLRG